MMGVVFMGIVMMGWLARSWMKPKNVLNWQVFSSEVLAERVSQQRIVFVDFTADWCLSCKVNESLTFDRASTQTFISKHNIELLKADWTKQDPKITQTLARFNRIGVPLYLLFVPGKRDPIVLPEVLTAGVFVRAVEQALEGSLK